MSDARIAWVIFAPMLVGGIISLLQALNGRLRLSCRSVERLNVASLALASGALLLGPVLLLDGSGETNLPALGLSLAVSSLARLGLVAANACLFCLLIVSWSQPALGDPSHVMGAAMFTSGLLAGALLATDAPVAAFCLFGVALLVGVMAVLPLVTHPNDAINSGDDARRLTGGLKHVVLSVVATGLLVAGGLLLARYPFNQQNTAVLQAGLGLLVVGLAVRAGAMPFAGASADLLGAAPAAAILALGASGPVVIVAGLLMLRQPGPGLAGMSEASSQVVLWIGAAGALLVGLRALAVGRGPWSREQGLAALLASSVALQTSWALFGVFSGSRPGALGAALLAANMALAVPLIVQGPRLLEGTWNLGLAVGAASLLGLPPLGGFVGAMSVAQAAVEAGGWWLAVLLLGSVGVAIAWLRAIPGFLDAQAAEPSEKRPFPPAAHLRLLTWTLVGAQLLLFVLSLLMRET